MMKRLVLLFCLLAVPAFAQQSVITYPGTRTTTNASGTVAVTNTFQSVFVASAARTSCTIQNKSASNVMYVFFGPIGSATLAKAVSLATGQAVMCSANNIILTDQVSVTGTSGDAFYAAAQ